MSLFHTSLIPSKLRRGKDRAALRAHRWTRRGAAPEVIAALHTVGYSGSHQSKEIGTPGIALKLTARCLTGLS